MMVITHAAQSLVPYFGRPSSSFAVRTFSCASNSACRLLFFATHMRRTLRYSDRGMTDDISLVTVRVLSAGFLFSPEPLGDITALRCTPAPIS